MDFLYHEEMILGQQLIEKANIKTHVKGSADWAIRLTLTWDGGFFCTMDKCYLDCS